MSRVAKEEVTVLVGARLPLALRQKLVAAAKAKDLTVSQYLRMVLRERLGDDEA